MDSPFGLWLTLRKRSQPPWEWEGWGPVTEKPRQNKPLKGRDDKSTASTVTEDQNSPSNEQSASRFLWKVGDPRIDELKSLFRTLCVEDRLDMKLFRNFSPGQVKIAEAILRKRYKVELWDRILKFEGDSLETFDYILPKRMDHCEKTSMSLKLTILRERFKESQYGHSRPKDLHDAINAAFFRKYFHPCFDPEALVEVSRHSISPIPETMPRRSAIFCMKKGLTKSWFKAISSKFLKEVLSISCEEMQSYYFDKFSIKLNEIFNPKGDHFTDSYYDEMLSKINSDKFKLPFTSKELQFCEFKASKKIQKLQKYTVMQEMQEFRAKFGDQMFKAELDRWSGPNCGLPAPNTLMSTPNKFSQLK